MSALDTVLRLRRHREREAQRALSEARAATARVDTALTALQTTVTAARARLDPHDAADVTRRHVYAVRSEMQRRAVERHRDELAKVEDQHQQRSHLASRNAEVAQKLVESHAARRDEELRRHERQRLDSAGLRAWWSHR